MRALENQTILLISPQPWDHIRISKHHYALELARRGNSVFFLEPPKLAQRDAVEAERMPDAEGVTRVSYRPTFPFAVRFHARAVFDRLMRFQIRRILRVIGKPLDVVWSFEFNLFSDLRAFGAERVIFHPVDPLSQRAQVLVARSADAVISVSNEILSNFADIDAPRWLINHGLSRPFEAAARNPRTEASKSAGRSRVGYSGNLSRPALNRDVLKKMIADNPEAEFHFWGPVDAEDLAQQFIDHLRGAANVKLHGRVDEHRLAREIQEMDCHVLAYSLDERESDRSNSHKILEYLSTGKVIVSSRIAMYSEHDDLLRMPAGADDAILPAMLTDTLKRLPEFNSKELQPARRKLALDNTYERQIERIADKLDALPQQKPTR